MNMNDGGSSFLPGTASEGQIAEYSEGFCHVFAIALHKEFGWSMLVVTDDNEVWWEDEDDPDNFIPAVNHVYAVDANGLAWDIAGCRQEGDVAAEVAERFGVMETSQDECRGLGEMVMYVDGLSDDDDIERPLFSYSQADVDRALAVAKQVLSCLPGFPSDLPVEAPYENPSEATKKSKFKV